MQWKFLHPKKTERFYGVLFVYIILIQVEMQAVIRHIYGIEARGGGTQGK